MKSALSALVVGAVAGLVLMTACGGSEKASTDPTSEVSCAVGLSRISPSSATLHPGDTLRVLAIDTPCFGSPAIVAAQWTSSDTSVATIGPNNGLIRAFSRGQATIIATDPHDPNQKSAMALAVQ
jgi:uncharacterized protein YjdB